VGVLGVLAAKGGGGGVLEMSFTFFGDDVMNGWKEKAFSSPV